MFPSLGDRGLVSPRTSAAAAPPPPATAADFPFFFGTHTPDSYTPERTDTAWHGTAREQIEQEVAAFMGTEEAISYSDSSTTISSTIPAFAKKGDLTIVDQVRQETAGGNDRPVVARRRTVYAGNLQHVME